MNMFWFQLTRPQTLLSHFVDAFEKGLGNTKTYKINTKTFKDEKSIFDDDLIQTMRFALSIRENRVSVLRYIGYRSSTKDHIKHAISQTICYNIDILRQNTFMVISPIMNDNFASLFNRTIVNRSSD